MMILIGYFGHDWHWVKLEEIFTEIGTDDEIDCRVTVIFNKKPAKISYTSPISRKINCRRTEVC